MTFLPQQKEQLPQGSPVWNVHIPRGTDLSPAMVTESTSRAAKILPAVFPEHKADYFLCYSWLLYPGMNDLLPEKAIFAALLSGSPSSVPYRIRWRLLKIFTGNSIPEKYHILRIRLCSVQLWGIFPNLAMPVGLLK